MCDNTETAQHTVTLLGGGPVDEAVLAQALRLAPYLVAADGGANYALAHKIPVKHIVGDFDSLTNFEYWRNSGVKLSQLDEQDTTDFEKCIYTTQARRYICVGFLGDRLDHTLACLRTLAAHPDRAVILLSTTDVAFIVPGKITLNIPVGTTVSLFPMGPVEGIASTGLKWPVRGLKFDPSGQIGTSNRATAKEISVTLSNRKMVMILPRSCLEEVFRTLDD